MAPVRFPDSVPSVNFRERENVSIYSQREYVEDGRLSRECTNIGDWVCWFLGSFRHWLCRRRRRCVQYLLLLLVRSYTFFHHRLCEHSSLDRTGHTKGETWLRVSHRASSGVHWLATYSTHRLELDLAHLCLRISHFGTQIQLPFMGIQPGDLARWPKLTTRVWSAPQGAAG